MTTFWLELHRNDITVKILVSVVLQVKPNCRVLWLGSFLINKTIK